MHPRSAAIEQAKSLIPSLDACSFDIFDTFLLRRCTAPDGVFELAWQLLTAPGGPTFPKETFVQHRVQAEACARRAAAETRGSVEVGIDEIYAHFPLKLFGFTRDDIARLIETEFAAEVRLCRVNPEIAALVEAMEAAGVSTGFISDSYWPAARIAHLLSACRPGLRYDFLFVSCAYGTGKADALFQHYLAHQQIAPGRALHIGDNEGADIKGAARAKIAALHYPQAAPCLRDIEETEGFVFRAFCTQPHQSARLDSGLRTIRRALARTAPGDDGAGAFGERVLGPVMAGFDRFVAERIDRLKVDEARNVAIAFLGRDGMLPFKLWRQRHDASAYYLEINRRVSLIASADTAAPLCKLFKGIPLVDADTVHAILKAHRSRIDDFFRTRGGAPIPGAQFAKILPTLLTADQFAAMAARMRTELFAYLQATIPDFGACTDLVLVDLGYSATVQKALRRSFDLAGRTIRLHGLYLLTLDDALGDIAEPDRAEGFISDFVVAPHSKRAMLRNVAPLEQMCSAGTGSVQYYEDGGVVREDDPRPPRQLALCEAAQASALAFAEGLDALTPQSQIDPFADEATAAAWCAAIVARALLMPSPDELALLSPAAHDVNLGTRTMVPLIDAPPIRDLEFTGDLATAFTAPEPPMWLGGSLAQQSALHGALYALFGAGLLPGPLMTGRKAGSVEVALISGAQARPAAVPVYESPGGQIRLRIPTLKTMGVSTIAIPIGCLAAQGRLVRAVTQTGPTVAKALAHPRVEDIPAEGLNWIGVAHEGAQFLDAAPDRAYLAVTLPPSQAEATVITLAFETTANAQAPLTANHSNTPAAA